MLFHLYRRNYTEVKTRCLFCPVLNLKNQHSVRHRMDTKMYRFTQGHTNTSEEGLVFGTIDSQPFFVPKYWTFGRFKKTSFPNGVKEIH